MGLITDVVIVNKTDYEKNPEKYAKFLRGIYRAVDLYNKDPDKFLEVAAPAFDMKPEQMKVDIEGVYYTSYEDAIEYMGSGDDSRLISVVDGLNEINVDLDLMDKAIPYEAIINADLIDGLFEGKTR